MLSIIVPVYRQWECVPALLEALANQQIPAGVAVEILLVDNEPEATADRPDLPPGITLLPCATPGSYAARNAGAALARGRLFLFTDADCRPRPGWLAALWAASGGLQADDGAAGGQAPARTCATVSGQPDRAGGGKPGPEAAGGGQSGRPLRPDTARPLRSPAGVLLAGPVEISLPEQPNPWQIFDAVRGIPQALFIAHGYAATANLAVPATIFRALGGFDPGRLSGGDAEFCRRAGQARHRLHLVPGAVVDHPARASYAELAIKARRIKGGQVGAGPFRRRLFWTLRSLAPPLRECLHYLQSPHSLRHRLTAIGVRFRLWGVELAELTRLLSRRKAPERR